MAVANELQLSAQRRIGFGVPVYVAFGLTRPQAKNHRAAKLLMTMGDDLSLDYCAVYN
ncbi:hypothetical protein [Rhodoferax sp.]|uniref:hypothetical protein n=1 Tax=Rhodoferax sp. TaxID=50421 RepID=UPI002ACE4772|nr:hypothetical protein [Rhodoferax sp.]MDZ7920664.1 hypothetical protein [Rhodoferax sp.]